MKPHLYVFEGPNGAGKTTQIKAVSKHLVTRGIPHICTKEPDIRPHGELWDTTDNVAEFFLRLASRAQHQARVIQPALDRGLPVLMDRHWPSTWVYQIRYASAKDTKMMFGMLPRYQPPMTIFNIWCSTATTTDRLKARRSTIPMNHADIVEGYRMVHGIRPETLIRIDGEAPPSVVTHSILFHL